jgi:hypothetical protein
VDFVLARHRELPWAVGILLRTKLARAGSPEGLAAVCHARAIFYPGDAWQFLEAVLNIPEKLRGLVRKTVGDLNTERSAVVV